jgi:hypothetical protein
VGVRHGVTGFHAKSSEALTQSLLLLMKSEILLKEMSAAARRFASARGWNRVFEQLYQTYEMGLAMSPGLAAIQS